MLYAVHFLTMLPTVIIQGVQYFHLLQKTTFLALPEFGIPGPFDNMHERSFSMNNSLSYGRMVFTRGSLPLPPK